MKLTNKELNNITAQIMDLQAAQYFLSIALRGTINRLETIRETNPEIALDRDIEQATKILEQNKCHLKPLWLKAPWE